MIHIPLQFLFTKSRTPFITEIGVMVPQYIIYGGFIVDMSSIYMAQSLLEMIKTSCSLPRMFIF